MNYAIHRIYLDIHDTTSRVTIYVKRNDSNRKIVATLMDNGKPYSISSECQVGFSTKALDVPVYCDIVNNTIECVVSTSVTKKVGVYECEFKLYGTNVLTNEAGEEETTDALITSPRFTIIVEDAIHNGEDVTEGIPDESVWSGLVSNLTNAISNAKDRMRDIDNAITTVNDVVYRGNELQYDIETKLANGELNGKDGADGYTPIKGKDYFDGAKGDKGDKGDPYTLTDADKQTITNAVISALPVYSGEVVDV